MASIHPDIEHYQQLQKVQESKKIKTMIRLAFSEYRRGKEGEPRASRLCDKLIKEKDLNILSEQIFRISESILNLKLFDTFDNSPIIQSSMKSVGFDVDKTKSRLGINQIYIKLQTYQDYMDFLKNNNLWQHTNNAQKCDILQHREFLQIAHNLYDYFTNNQYDNDHYGNRKQIGDEQDSEDDEDE